MVPYNPHSEPSWQWGSTSVQASIILDQPNVTFTNLDEITGRVVLRCAKAISISGIVVKLEGESKTRLIGQTSTSQDQSRVELEHHKILYKTLNVFPPLSSASSNKTDLGDNGKVVHTLPAGSHEYPFKLKLPFNNACHTPPTKIPGVHIGMSNGGLEVMKEATRHVKKTLPPTLTGFPGEAEISYFIKVTVSRQGLLKENPRSYAPFNFLPIEPPRPTPTGSQIFSRQTHTFSPGVDQANGRRKSKSFFGIGSSTSASSAEALSVTAEMRLPQPAIITCNKLLPLAILIKKINSASSMIYLESLQVALIGNTKVKAHELERVEQNTWIIVSKANMHIPVGSVSDPAGTEILLDSSLWQQAPLPSTVAPSFETCNISRSYQVDVRIGLSYDVISETSGGKPQLAILPMRLDTLIFSGIAPPAEVLDRISRAQSGLPAGAKSPAATVQPHIPMAARPDAPPVYSEAPPSYEDAIAADLPPVDGMRPAYAPPPSDHDALLNGDRKR